MVFCEIGISLVVSLLCDGFHLGDDHRVYCLMFISLSKTENQFYHVFNYF